MIHPRRLKGAPANIARYYTVGDYYTEGADEHSEWGGALAADLGLSGRVDPAVFRELLAGKVAGQQLVRHRHEGGIEHHSGWDFAVNAPKSVSIVLLVGIAGYAGRRFPSARLPLAIAGLAAGGILLSIAGLVVLAAAMAGVSPDAVDRATIVMVLGATVAGTAWILRIVALTAVLALARHPLAAGLAGAVALATLGWSGHG
ncbi:MAG: relaxase domain-containing protein, partial [Sphingomonas fennica]